MADTAATCFLPTLTHAAFNRKLGAENKLLYLESVYIILLLTEQTHANVLYGVKMYRMPHVSFEV